MSTLARQLMGEEKRDMNMKKTIAGFLWVALIGALSFGCASETPQEVCEDRCVWMTDHCGGTAPETCPSICTDMRSTSEHMGCLAEVDAAEQCHNEQSQCDTSDTCAGPNGAMTFCILSFCSSHLDDPSCRNASP